MYSSFIKLVERSIRPKKPKSKKWSLTPKMVFLLLSLLWVCRIGKKKHTLSQNNEITTYYNDLLKNTALTTIAVDLWFVISICYSGNLSRLTIFTTNGLNLPVITSNGQNFWPFTAYGKLHRDSVFAYSLCCLVGRRHDVNNRHDILK